MIRRLDAEELFLGLQPVWCECGNLVGEVRSRTPRFIRTCECDEPADDVVDDDPPRSSRGHVYNVDLLR